MSKFFIVFLIFSSLFLSNFVAQNVKAANDCSISIQPSIIEPGGPVTITVSGAIFNDHAITPADGEFFLETNPYDIPTGNLIFEDGVATLQIADSSGLFSSDGQTYELNMFHKTGWLWDEEVCGPSNQVFIQESGINPNLGCESVVIDPSTISLGQSDPLPTVIASGCPVEDSMFAVIVSYEGVDIYASDNFPAEDDGTINFPVNVFSDIGLYEVKLVNRLNPSEHVMSVTVTESTEDVIYSCDQVVPLNTQNCSSGQTTNCCPADCEAGYRPVFGSEQFNEYACKCGDYAGNCCPGSGTPYCKGSSLVCNSQNNKCENAQTGVSQYVCGEVIEQPDLDTGNFTCVGCDLEQKDGNGPLWCACGGQGELCCETGPDDCGENLFCNGGLCVDPDITDRDSLVLCDDQRSIATAVGCVRFDSLNILVANVTALLLGTSGGVALVLMGYAALSIATSSGDPKTIQGSKELLMSAIGGVIMVALSVFLLRVIGVDILGLFG